TRPRAGDASPVELDGAGTGDVLLLSMRKLEPVVGYTAMYEFEDLAFELLNADLALPTQRAALERSRKVYKAFRHLTGSRWIADLMRPAGDAFTVQRDYALFLAVFNHPYELFNLRALKDWRARSRFAACYVNEAWEAELPVYLVELLSTFDHIFVGVAGSRDVLARVSGRPCSYLPMGVDALRFAPRLSPPSSRLIDVCGIGRRSDVTHAALLDLARREGLFYYYDTMKRGRGAGQAVTFEVIDPGEHRLLFANLLKRSRYFIANRAWADRPSLTLGKEEIPSRFYEGAAAGAIMLGEPPDTDEFRRQFDWPEAVVPTPFHAAEIGQVIRALDSDPARAARIRADGVEQALRRHDWSHRLRDVLAAAGMPATPALCSRQERLAALAEQVRPALVRTA
ncbi:MAG TPA: glycosyltransferase, partial [Myxococcaceae bacterium]|nr:glycosyltransferase [Myxococcaceae bacterium]